MYAFLCFGSILKSHGSESSKKLPILPFFMLQLLISEEVRDRANQNKIWVHMQCQWPQHFWKFSKNLSFQNFRKIFKIINVHLSQKLLPIKRNRRKFRSMRIVYDHSTKLSNFSLFPKNGLRYIERTQIWDHSKFTNLGNFGNHFCKERFKVYSISSRSLFIDPNWVTAEVVSSASAERMESYFTVPNLTATLSLKYAFLFSEL